VVFEFDGDLKERSFEARSPLFLPASNRFLGLFEGKKERRDSMKLMGRGAQERGVPSQSIGALRTQNGVGGEVAASTKEELGNHVACILQKACSSRWS
jgi:hypothetical protein